MFRGLARISKVFILKHTLKKKAPERIHLSESTNCVSTVLKDRNSGQEVLLERIDEERIYGLVWDGNRFAEPTDFAISDIDSWSIDIDRYYGNNILRHHGPLGYILSEFFRQPQFLYLISKLRQKLFNYQTRFRHDRIDLLSKIIELHLSKAEKENGLLFTARSLSVIGLITEVYGSRVYAHPHFKRESARFRLLIDSLAETGDLEKTNSHEFKLNAKAIASISSYEMEERRHRDSIRQNWILVIFTIVMATAAVAQALTAFLK